MRLLRIREVVPLAGTRLRLTLTNGRVIERDVGALMLGPIFASVRGDPNLFRAVRVEGGTATWPNGADLCPDVLIWHGPPPPDPDAEPPDR